MVLTITRSAFDENEHMLCIIDSQRNNFPSRKISDGVPYLVFSCVGVDIGPLIIVSCADDDKSRILTTPLPSPVHAAFYFSRPALSICFGFLLF